MATAAPPKHLVVVGGSAGAWPVLQLILANLPPNLDAALIVVIHRSPHVVSDIARVLNGFSPLTVVEPKEAEPLRAAHVYPRRRTAI